MAQDLSYLSNTNTVETGLENGFPAEKDLGEAGESWGSADQEQTTEALAKTEIGVDLQGEHVHELATEYWQNFVLTRERESSEASKFEFQGRTFQDREDYLQRIERAIAQLETDGDQGELEEVTQENAKDETEKEQQIVDLRHFRTKIIIEQAYADISWKRLKLQEVKDEVQRVTEAVSVVKSAEELADLRQKITELSREQTKFEVYSKAAEQLFKDFYEVYPVEAREEFLNWTNEMIERAELVDIKTRSEGENDLNLEIVREEIYRINQINWVRVNQLLQEREAELTLATPEKIEWQEKIEHELEPSVAATPDQNDALSKAA